MWKDFEQTFEAEPKTIVGWTCACGTENDDRLLGKMEGGMEILNTCSGCGKEMAILVPNFTIVPRERFIEPDYEEDAEAVEKENERISRMISPVDVRNARLGSRENRINGIDFTINYDDGFQAHMRGKYHLLANTLEVKFTDQHGKTLEMEDWQASDIRMLLLMLADGFTGKHEAIDASDYRRRLKR